MKKFRLYTSDVEDDINLFSVAIFYECTMNY